MLIFITIIIILIFIIRICRIKIGVNDVSDMVQSLHGVTDYFNNNSNQKPSFRVDLKRVAIVGGSHGGFLAGQLISQFPDMFRVSVMRNPVTNIPFMTASSGKRFYI